MTNPIPCSNCNEVPILENYNDNNDKWYTQAQCWKCWHKVTSGPHKTPELSDRAAIRMWNQIQREQTMTAKKTELRKRDAELHTLLTGEPVEWHHSAAMLTYDKQPFAVTEGDKTYMVPEYSSDDNDALVFIEKLRQLGWHSEIHWRDDGQMHCYMFKLGPFTDGAWWPYAEGSADADTLPEVVTLAAKVAMEAKDDTTSKSES